MFKLAQRLGASRFEADEAYLGALAAYRRKDLKEALAQIESAIARHPSHAEYHATLAWFQLERGDASPAREGFERTITINPYEMLANYGLGVLAYKDKDWETAAGYFLNAMAAQPGRPETMYYLSLVRHRQGDNERALHWMQKAQQEFAAADDKREKQCHAWMREFAKLADEDRTRV
ncbi:MAG: tetratricopeptide repeat protein [Chloroflexi bacterium]|nr:tetratricopeptide repeat protein [Chloroflexota bacterium]